MALATTPSVGRVVHYVAYGTPGGEFPSGVHRAAIITAVYAHNFRSDVRGPHPGDGGQGTVDLSTVDLIVLNPFGFAFYQRVAFDPAGQRTGTWHWPEHIPPTEVPDPPDVTV